MKEKEKNRKDDGFLSFEPEELKNATPDGHPNDEAYELLWEATCVSSHVDKVDQAAGRTDEDNVYPTTAAEVAAMGELISQAEAALKEPDEEFSQRVAELRSIVEWSSKRHWKLNWQVIVGVIISVFVLQMCVDSKQSDVMKVENLAVQVNKWAEEPLTALDIESLKDNGNIDYSTDSYSSAALWHKNRQIAAANGYYRALATIADCQEALKDKSMAKELRGSKEKQLKEANKKKKELLKRFNKLRKADFDDVRKMALKEIDSKISERKADARFVKFWNLFFLLLIPVYIFAARPYGYTISRYRREADNLGKIEKIGLWLSGGLLSAGAGIGFVDIVTKWSDGSVTRSDDGTGPIRLAIKVGLFVGAVLVFCGVSCFLMLYATITGLIRNYDWREVKRQAIEAGTAAKSKYDQVRSEQK